MPLKLAFSPFKLGDYVNTSQLFCKFPPFELAFRPFKLARRSSSELEWQMRFLEESLNGSRNSTAQALFRPFKLGSRPFKLGFAVQARGRSSSARFFFAGSYFYNDFSNFIISYAFLHGILAWAFNFLYIFTHYPSLGLQFHMHLYTVS